MTPEQILPVLHSKYRSGDMVRVRQEDDALQIVPCGQRGLWDTSQAQAAVYHSVALGFTLSYKLQWKQERSGNICLAQWFTSQHKANEMVRVSTPGNQRWFHPSTGKEKLAPSLTRSMRVARTDLCYSCQVMLWRCSGKMHKLNLSTLYEGSQNWQSFQRFWCTQAKNHETVATGFQPWLLGHSKI